MAQVMLELHLSETGILWDKPQEQDIYNFYSTIKCSKYFHTHYADILGSRWVSLVPPEGEEIET